MISPGRKSFLKDIGVVLIPLFLFLLADTAQACGWWGDSEMSSRRETATVTPEGHSIEHTINLANMKLPDRMGYGIAVPEPGRAIPYLLATFGQPINRIQDLKIFGFRSVIDLGTPSSSAKHHREESEGVGMTYFNIPDVKTLAAPQTSQRFIDILLNPANTPLLVYAAKADLIAVMWASYRLHMGSPVDFSITEGRILGLTGEQEEMLRSRR